MSKKRRQAPAAPEATFSLDAFQNTLARMGLGTPQLLEATEYPMTRLTRDWQQMNSLYRGHWIVQRIIDAVPNDMTKNWYQLSTELNPKLLDRFTAQERKTQVRAKINTALKWARLYGGAGALMILAGHGDRMAEPLDLDTVLPGSFKGLMVLDRWIGIAPGSGTVTDLDDPEFGLPDYYTVTLRSGVSLPVHHSRVLRFTGREMPALEQAMEQHWGTSEMEAVFDELRKRDNASWAIACLLFRANLLFFKTGDIGQQIATTNVRGQQQLYNVMSAINRMMSNNGLTMLGREDDVISQQYAFSGLPEVYDRFMMDISGATGIPVTRLFGRSPAGMNATGESDMELYYSMLEEQQESRLYPALTKLLPVMAMSAWGATPEDLDLRFNPVRTLSPKDQLEMAKGQAEMVISVSNAGLISDQAALKELKRYGEPLGLWVSITDEDVKQADDMPNEKGEEPDGEAPQLPFGLSMDAWKEEEHERDEDGKFTSGEGGSGGRGSSEESEREEKSSKPAKPNQPGNAANASNRGQRQSQQPGGGKSKGSATQKLGKTLDPEEVERYNGILKGTITGDGVAISRISKHAFERFGQRPILPETTKRLLEIDKFPEPGQTPRTRVYGKGEVKVIVDIYDGVIVTVYKSKKAKKAWERSRGKR